MYERFFHLTETPFSIAPNPHYLYMSQQHNDALAHLIYGVGRDGGFVLLTGEVGTGKTTVCRCFLEQVPEDTNVAFILNPKLQVEELLATICDELSIPYIADHVTIKDYTDFINRYLLKQHANGRHTVLIIDEAQNLSSEVLEQIRLLTNLETNQKKLLQIVMLGQPELHEMFKQPNLRQLSQRVTARFHLRALNSDEVGPYIYHRLTVAGALDPTTTFPPAIVSRIYHISKGIPRIINMICDRALLGAYATETRVINNEIISNAAREVLGYNVHVPAVGNIKIDRNWMVAGITAIACTVTLVLTYGFLYQGWWQSDSVGMAGVHNSGTPETVAQSVQPTEALAPESAMVSSQAELPPLNMETQSINAVIAGDESIVADVDTQAKKADWSLNHVFEYTDTDGDKQAYQELFAIWGEDFDPDQDGNPCKFAAKKGLECLSKVGSLGSIKHYGIPVMLRLFGERGEERYVVIRRLKHNVAEVQVDGGTKTLDVTDLDEYWRGHFSLLWKKPPNYHGPMKPGTIAPLSKWLSYQLDIWEEKPEPALGRSSYNDQLVERVKAFQRMVGESDDGIVGSDTLIQLTRRVDDSVPLLNAEREQL